jgi:hypothetical protein
MTERQPERRRHDRIVTKGTLIFRGAQHEQRGRIINVSVGGVYVVTQVATPIRMLARAVEIELRLDARTDEWVRATGRITRLRPDGVAIAFDPLVVPLPRVLDELASLARANARIITVVLIDAHTQRRTAMAAGFRSIGCRVEEVNTPLEAIVRLGESSFEPDVIAVANSQPANEADDMRTFVSAHHPSSKLITIGDELLKPDGFAHWLSSANPADDLSARVLDAVIAPKRGR